MLFTNITESESKYHDIEQMSVAEIIQHINTEDKGVAVAVQAVLPQIEALINAIVTKMQSGGRLFYIGAGTSGRLGVLDASECPPTFGVSPEMVTGIIAGGDIALRQAVEFAEDDTLAGWRDLQAHSIATHDFVIGLAASGTTPYVWGALQECRKNGIATGCIVCNPNSIVEAHADFAVAVITGPEFITGSTRMKSGTAQKMVLNLVSTTVMVKLGRVEGNKMVNMQLSNAKLVDRGVRMVMQQRPEADYAKAKDLLLSAGTVKKAIERS